MTAITVPGRKLLPDGTPPPILVERMRVAMELVKADSSVKMLILSGGKVPMNRDEVERIGTSSDSADARPPATEAHAMQKLALEIGLPDGIQVLLETEALNTLENAVNIRRMLEAHPGEIRKLKVVTSTFHMPRTKGSFEAIFDPSGPVALEFQSSPDDSLTASEREREELVEPAMTARLPAQAKIYRQYLEGLFSLEEARRRFFHRDEPHSDVWLIPVEDIEKVAAEPPPLPPAVPSHT